MAGLLQPQGSTAALRVMFNHRLHAWRTGLLIPEPKLCEVDTATILHGAHEILASDGLPVMPLEIKVSALAETIRPQHQRHHPDQFSAFVVYRGGVEIRDFHIGFRPHRMGERARSEEHTSELQSLMRTSYAVFCLTKKTTKH